MNVQIPIAQPVIPTFATWETEANQLGLQGEHRRYAISMASPGNSVSHCETKAT